MDDLDLRDLSAFAAVARQRNFRRAALEQRVSVSTLSERVRALEERLGLRLLNRTTRSVAPTEAGQRLLDRLAPALREVVEAVAQVRGAADDPSGRLRINAPPPAAQLVLAPLVAGFLERFPRVTLEVVTDSALIDIVEDGFDAGVRYEEHLAQDMIAVPLGPPERYVIVASPALLAVHGVPRTPEDLRDRPCLATRFRSGRQLPWEFEKDGQTLRIQPEARLSSTLTALLIQAAIDGAGFFLAFEGHVRDAVADGRLVTVLDDWCPPFPGPFLYYPSRRQPPPALAAFVAYIAERRRAAGW